MECDFQSAAFLEFENMSRSERWLALRKYLIKLNKAISAVADVANEEAQREISLTLNDDLEYDVSSITQEIRKSPVVLSEKQFIDELAKLPHIGMKAAQDIAAYMALAQDEKVLDFAGALVELNNDIALCGGILQSTLDLD